MNGEARLLMLDDSADDLILIERELRRGGIDFVSQQVHTREEFLEALRQFSPDLILADYLLPELDGLQALKIALDICPWAPVILVSGLLGEERAIEALKSGATDYILKDRLARLTPAVRRALDEVQQRQKRMQAEAAVRESEAKFAALAEHAPAMIFIHKDGRFRYVNAAAEKILGYSRSELLRMDFWEVLHPDCHDQIRSRGLGRQNGEDLSSGSEFQIVNKAGSTRWLRCSASCIEFGGEPAVLGMAFDITETKEAEGVLRAFSLLGLELNATTTPIAAARLVVEIAETLFGWDACYLHLYAPDPGEIIPVLTMDTVAGRKTALPPKAFTLDPSPWMREVIAKGARLINRKPSELCAFERPVLESKIDDPKCAIDSPDLVRFGDTGRLSASMMYVPIRHGDSIVGIFSIQSYAVGAYSEEDLQTFQALADHCAGALERIRAVVGSKRMENELLEISMAERRRIGHELHDGLGQYLTGVAFRAKALEQILVAEGNSQAAEADKLANFISQAIGQVRSLARGLDPVEVASVGLVAALRNLAFETQHFFNVTCIFRSGGLGAMEAVLSVQYGLTLYRIAQEAIHNAINHGEPRRITLDLSIVADQVCLAIEDDGKGFERLTTGNWLEPHAGVKPVANGMGLRVMEYRVRSIGGKLEISSQLNAGTLVRCSLPCERCSAGSNTTASSA